MTGRRPACRPFSDSVGPGPNLGRCVSNAPTLTGWLGERAVADDAGAIKWVVFDPAPGSDLERAHPIVGHVEARVGHTQGGFPNLLITARLKVLHGGGAAIDVELELDGRLEVRLVARIGHHRDQVYGHCLRSSLLPGHEPFVSLTLLRGFGHIWHGVAPTNGVVVKHGAAAGPQRCGNRSAEYEILNVSHPGHLLCRPCPFFPLGHGRGSFADGGEDGG